jgi:hypothetical protein
MLTEQTYHAGKNRGITRDAKWQAQNANLTLHYPGHAKQDARDYVTLLQDDATIQGAIGRNANLHAIYEAATDHAGHVGAVCSDIKRLDRVGCQARTVKVAKGKRLMLECRVAGIKTCVEMPNRHSGTGKAALP